MSASLDATRALLNAKGIRYKLERSPVTGQMAVYSQTIGASVVASGTPVNTGNLITAINDGLTAQAVDFLPASTAVGYLGMALSETYYPEVWVNTAVSADGKLQYFNKTGTLIAPAVLAVAVLAIILGFFVTDVLWNVYKAEHSFAYRNPNSGSIETILGETQFLTTLNSLYWYVCQKDGTGIGLKSQYPTLAQYQASPNYQAEMDYLKNHCENAQDLIGSRLNDWLNMIILGVVVIGGVYVVAKVLPSIFSRNRG